jgi:FtsP/CotA-like multicopper oxidase with cupredoxin domain
MSRSRLRALLACLVAAAIVVPLAWMWWASRLPDSYSVMDMGVHDFGGGPTASDPHAGHGSPGTGGNAGASAGGAVSVADLTLADGRPADVTEDLVAEQGTMTLASGREVEGYSLNGSSPGPTIEATEGDVVEVNVRNESVRDGMTLHWHGVDVPNAEDGVAGVTQDAIAVGETHTYRFLAEDPGTYWYHSHQVSHEQVIGGLLGAVIVHPGRDDGVDLDALALTHTYRGVRTLNGHEGDVPFVAAPGETVRVRVVNTDNGTTQVWSGAAYRVLAVDGFDLNEPSPVTGRSVTLTAGGRADLEVRVPEDGSAVRVTVGGSTALVVGPEGSDAAEVEQPSEPLDLLSYGSPADLGLDPAAADRSFDYDIGRRPGFLDGKPGVWWTVNGKMFPDVPMYVVREGDVVRMRIHNGSSETHPMHLHGHHAVVLSRDGEPATGSPWWVDSLDVRAGETYEIAFLADNPGIWMDHCHNLPHAAEGLVAHLMYDGVTTPYVVGGSAANEPE